MATDEGKLDAVSGKQEQISDEVLSWLDDLFDADKMFFSASENEIFEVSKIMKKSKQMDFFYKNSVALLEHLRADYDTEVIKLEQILDHVSLLPEFFSSSGQLSIKVLAESAAALELTNSLLSSFCSATADLQSNLEKLKSSIREEDEEAIRLEQATNDVLSKCSKLRRFQDTFEHEAPVQYSVLETKSKETKFLAAKCKQYDKDNNRLQNIMLEHGLNNDLNHEALLVLAEELRRLYQEQETLQSQLNAYKSLPPDIPLARVKVELALREMNHLDSQLSENIESLKL